MHFVVSQQQLQLAQVVTIKQQQAVLTTGIMVCFGLLCGQMCVRPGFTESSAAGKPHNTSHWLQHQSRLVKLLLGHS
jgi:hypothetical protein